MLLYTQASASGRSVPILYFYRFQRIKVSSFSLWAFDLSSIFSNFYYKLLLLSMPLKFLSNKSSNPLRISAVIWAHLLQKLPQITFYIENALFIWSLIYFYLRAYSSLILYSSRFRLIHLFFMFQEFSTVSCMIFCLSFNTLNSSYSLTLFSLFCSIFFLRFQLQLESEVSSVR